jgi:hypothetical protein
MNLEDYRTLFLVLTLVLVLVAVSPVLSVVVPFGGGSESFSELWLLGPDHMAEGYPSIFRDGEVYRVFVGVGNQMGSSEYYLIYVKAGNSTNILPDVDNSLAGSLPPLSEFRFVIADNEVWENTISFGFEDLVFEDDLLHVGYVVVDGVRFPVELSTTWDIERGGYYIQLFFELWRYDVVTGSFKFDDSFVGLWLKMTES